MIDWLPAPTFSDKDKLVKGITQWVAEQTGIANVWLPTLYRTNFDEVLLIAMAAGYRPPEIEETRLRERFVQRARSDAKRQAEDAVRYNLPIRLSDASKD